MPIPDRRKQRQEYLRKKAFYSIKAVSIVTAFLFTWVAFVGSAIVILYGIVTGRGSILLLGTGLAVLSVRSYGKFNLYVTKIQQQANGIDYIPPVTANTLSAEEVLVRSSQEPEQAQSAILLRAAEYADTPAEELLRASVENQIKA